MQTIPTTEAEFYIWDKRNDYMRLVIRALTKRLNECAEDFGEEFDYLGQEIIPLVTHDCWDRNGFVWWALQNLQELPVDMTELGNELANFFRIELSPFPVVLPSLSEAL